MPYYHFDIQDSVGEVEDLGGMFLTDDAEAVAFGETVIRDLLRDNPRSYARSTMRVTQGERAVRTILLA